MGVEILFSGLCVVQLLGGQPPTSAMVSCPSQTSHAMRLTVPARSIKSAPTGSVDWVIAPDGTEYASFPLRTKGAAVTFLDANGKPQSVGTFSVSNVSDLVEASQLGLGLVKSPKWKFELPIKEGVLGAVDDIPYCYLIGGKRVYFKEDLLWSGPTASGLSFQQPGVNGDIVLMLSQGVLKVSISNDVKQTTPGDILSAANEFGHWSMTNVLSGHFSTPGHCDIGTETRRPICNLLLVP
jgi:hypothetical protein